MRFYIDTEFIEKPNTIQLISIGIVSEDGKEYYAVSSEYNYDDASDWVKENVIRPIRNEIVENARKKSDIPNVNIFPDYDYPLQYFHLSQGKPLSQIKDEVLEFITQECHLQAIDNADYMVEQDNCKDKQEVQELIFKYAPPEFWGYYADYDWVVFCWLFGTMMELPEGFPMYCNDLQQLLNQYPKAKIDEPENEHNALADAKWNKELYESIMMYRSVINQNEQLKHQDYFIDGFLKLSKETFEQYPDLHGVNKVKLEIKKLIDIYFGK